MPLIVVIRPNCQGRNLLEKIIIIGTTTLLKDRLPNTNYISFTTTSLPLRILITFAPSPFTYSPKLSNDHFIFPFK